MTKIKTETWYLVAQALDGGRCSKYIGLTSIWAELNSPHLTEETLTLLNGLLFQVCVEQRDTINQGLLKSCKTKLNQLIK